MLTSSRITLFWLRKPWLNTADRTSQCLE